MLERRFIAGLEAKGRTLSGRALRYGDEAQIQTGFGVKRERFAPGAFGDVAKLDTTLDLQHAATRRIARTGGGGLVLAQQGADIMLAATLPETRDADDTLALVRAGVLRGFSIEFNATTDQWAGDVRTVTAAELPSIGVVDRPAYLSAQGIELRRALVDPGGTETRGAALVRLLEDRLPADGADRGAAIERMASAAGISVSTVGQILRAEIDCPPDERLRGFAAALGIGPDELARAVATDGCQRRRRMLVFL